METDIIVPPPDVPQPEDTWTLKEKLVLLSGKMKYDGHSWITVSRAVKSCCEENQASKPRPHEWYSAKNCAKQFQKLQEQYLSEFSDGVGQTRAERRGKPSEPWFKTMFLKVREELGAKMEEEMREIREKNVKKTKLAMRFEELQAKGPEGLSQAEWDEMVKISEHFENYVESLAEEERAYEASMIDRENRIAGYRAYKKFNARKQVGHPRIKTEQDATPIEPETSELIESPPSRVPPSPEKLRVSARRLSKKEKSPPPLPQSAPVAPLVVVKTEEPSPAPSSNSGSGEYPQENKAWRKSTMMLWRRIADHPHANVFMKPVSVGDAPDYYDVVKQPTSLIGIRKGIENGSIATNEHLVCQVRSLVSLFFHV